MKIWFIRHNNESLGPYTIDELKNLSVTKDDYVWKEGFTDWMQAASIPELKQLFISATPPPFQVATSEPSTPLNTEPWNYHSYYNPKPNKSRRRLVWISIVLVLSLVTYVIYANNQSTYVSPFSTQKSAEELKVDLAQTEKQNPTNYITGRTSHHQNLVNQTVLEGTLSNSATLAAFKDVVLQVDFLSKTNTIITTQNITVYESINPGQTIIFKKKIFVSKDVADVHVTIAGATPAN